MKSFSKYEDLYSHISSRIDNEDNEERKAALSLALSSFDDVDSKYINLITNCTIEDTYERNSISVELDFTSRHWNDEYDNNYALRIHFDVNVYTMSFNHIDTDIIGSPVVISKGVGTIGGRINALMYYLNV